MGKKGSMPNFETVDDYIASQSEEKQAILRELRGYIKEAVPETVEIQNYKVPSFTLIPGTKPEKQIMMAAYANFVSLYLSPITIDHFANDLKEYEKGKGTVKFPFKKPLPKDLIIQMVQFRKEEIMKDLS